MTQIEVTTRLEMCGLIMLFTMITGILYYRWWLSIWLRSSLKPYNRSSKPSSRSTVISLRDTLKYLKSYSKYHRAKKVQTGPK
jgi:hypothetical protein